MAEQIQQATMKDPKKVKAGKRLAEHNRRKREELAQMKAQKGKSENNLTYYGTEAVVAIGVLGIIGYYVYQSKTLQDKPKEALVHGPKETPDKFNMDWVIKRDKKTIVNDLYQAAVISAFAVGY